MRGFLSIITLGLGFGLLLGPVLPWWFVTAIGFLAGLVFYRNNVPPLMYGLAAGIVVWLGMDLVYYFTGAELITERMRDVIGLSSSTMLFAISAVLGGLTTALGTWSGAQLRLLVAKPRRR
jgi:hypothetical protein